MSISFGGLATGLDTNAIVSELMSLERRPITRLEGEKNYLNSRLKAFQDFDSKLKDFMATFGVGSDDRHIATIDTDGVALAGIQGLHRLIMEKDQKIEQLERRLGELETAIGLLTGK